MSASEIELIQAIKLLPLAKRIYVIEEALRSIKKEEITHQMGLAAQEFYEDYLKDKNLTAFTALDFEQFYEAR